MQNDNAVWCSTINARICGLGTDFNYHRNIFSQRRRETTCEHRVICSLLSLLLSFHADWHNYRGL